MQKEKQKNLFSNRGSLALEQILFISAVVVLSTGLYAFYGKMSDYLTNISFADSPTKIGEK